MLLSDDDLAVFDRQVLRLPEDDRAEYMRQVDYLIRRLVAKIREDGSFGVQKFLKAGSLRKRTVLKPRDGFGVDADIAVYLKIGDDFDLDTLQSRLLALLLAIYPQKSSNDFAEQPRTLGIEFLESGLAIDLVPIVPLDDEPGDYGLQPSWRGEAPTKTSIPRQLEFIQDHVNNDPRFRKLVRLLKRWRNHQDLGAFRSFAIEVLVAYLQDTRGPLLTIEEGLLRFFLFIAQTQLREPVYCVVDGVLPSFPDDPVVILDPVNVENNVTKRITDPELEAIVAAGTTAWETLNAARRKLTKAETLNCWRSIFGRSFTIDQA